MSDFTFTGPTDIGMWYAQNETMKVVCDGVTVWSGTYKEYGELLTLLQDSAPLYRREDVVLHDGWTNEETVHRYVQVYPEVTE